MGLYAGFADVRNRYEGAMSNNRQAWVELRIEDAESELFWLVPSLVEKTHVPADKAGRVTRLICDKVLALYRNPDGAVSTTSTLGPASESRTLPRTGAASWVAFTDDELVRVGYSKPSAGSVPLRAWYYPPVIPQV